MTAYNLRQPTTRQQPAVVVVRRQRRGGADLELRRQLQLSTVCLPCECTVASVVDVQTHQHKVAAIKCGKCAYQVDYRNSIDMASHYRIRHTEERPYLCPHCDKRYSWQSPLDQHIRRTHYYGRGRNNNNNNNNRSRRVKWPLEQALEEELVQPQQESQQKPQTRSQKRGGAAADLQQLRKRLAIAAVEKGVDQCVRQTISRQQMTPLQIFDNPFTVGQQISHYQQQQQSALGQHYHQQPSIVAATNNIIALSSSSSSSSSSSMVAANNNNNSLLVPIWMEGEDDAHLQQSSLNTDLVWRQQQLQQSNSNSSILLAAPSPMIAASGLHNSNASPNNFDAPMCSAQLRQLPQHSSTASFGEDVGSGFVSVPITTKTTMNQQMMRSMNDYFVGECEEETPMSSAASAQLRQSSEIRGGGRGGGSAASTSTIVITIDDDDSIDQKGIIRRVGAQVPPSTSAVERRTNRAIANLCSTAVNNGSQIHIGEILINADGIRIKDIDIRFFCQDCKQFGVRCQCQYGGPFCVRCCSHSNGLF